MECKLACKCVLTIIARWIFKTRMVVWTLARSNDCHQVNWWFSQCDAGTTSGYTGMYILWIANGAILQMSMTHCAVGCGVALLATSSVSFFLLFCGFFCFFLLLWFHSFTRLCWIFVSGYVFDLILLLYFVDYFVSGYVFGLICWVYFVDSFDSGYVFGFILLLDFVEFSCLATSLI